MEVRCGGEVFIFDAGSGLRELGMELMKEGPRKIHLLITHPHWDRIQEFPFFVPGFDISVYGAKGFGKDLESLFHGQLDMDYCSDQMADMNAKFQFVNFSGIPSKSAIIKSNGNMRNTQVQS